MPRRDDKAGYPDDRMVDVHAAEVPLSIRQAVLGLMSEGDALWRCPRKGPAGLLGFGQRKPVIEWWLIGADGDLIEAFWEE